MYVYFILFFYKVQGKFALVNDALKAAHPSGVVKFFFVSRAKPRPKKNYDQRH